MQPAEISAITFVINKIGKKEHFDVAAIIRNGASDLIASHDTSHAKAEQAL